MSKHSSHYQPTTHISYQHSTKFFNFAGMICESRDASKGHLPYIRTVLKVLILATVGISALDSLTEKLSFFN